MTKNKRIIPIKSKYGTFKTVFTWYKSDGGAWIVDVPSLPGAYTSGRTLSEARYMAKDVIDLVCEDEIDSGKIIIDDKNMAIGKLPHSRVITVRQ